MVEPNEHVLPTLVAGSIPLAGTVYLFGILAMHRMESAGQGFEAIFYVLPLVLLAAKIILLAGAVVGLIGAWHAKRHAYKVRAAFASLVCGALFAISFAT